MVQMTDRRRGHDRRTVQRGRPASAEPGSHVTIWIPVSVHIWLVQHAHETQQPPAVLARRLFLAAVSDEVRNTDGREVPTVARDVTLNPADPEHE